MIEPTGPESPGEPSPPRASGPGRRVWVAAVLVAAIAGGAVAAGVTLGISRTQGRTNPQTVDLGTHVTITENAAAVAVAQKASPAVVSIVATGALSAAGSGFLVTSDGYVVSNVLAVADVQGLGVVIGSETRRRDARLVDYDCSTGVAVLKVDGLSNAPTLAFGDSTALQAGQTVVAIGGAAGRRPGVRRGIVSSLHDAAIVTDPVLGSTQLTNLIQPDASLAPADSGGPLLNVGGEVVGVSVTTEGQTSYALSSSDVRTEVQEVITTGQLVVPSLGARTILITTTDSILTGETVGARITSVDAGGPAASAGLQTGDVVTQVDAQAIDDAHPLSQVLAAQFKPGQRATISYQRGSDSSQAQLTLAEAHPTC